MYIKQCLHMLTTLSVIALLGPVSSIRLCISLKLPLYKFTWNGLNMLFLAREVMGPRGGNTNIE